MAGEWVPLGTVSFAVPTKNMLRFKEIVPSGDEPVLASRVDEEGYGGSVYLCKDFVGVNFGETPRRLEVQVRVI